MDIINLFTNFDDLSNSNIPNSKKNQSISLNQGKKFNKYQHQIGDHLKKPFTKEGFGGINLDDENLKLKPNGLTIESKNVIDRNDYSSQQDTINDLRQKQYK